MISFCKQSMDVVCEIKHLSLCILTVSISLLILFLISLLAETLRSGWVTEQMSLWNYQLLERRVTDQ